VPDLGEIKFLFDFRLAVDQFVITLLLLEGRADLGSSSVARFCESLMSDSSRAARSSNPCTTGFERADGAQRRVGDAGAVTVFATQMSSAVLLKPARMDKSKPAKRPSRMSSPNEF